MEPVSELIPNEFQQLMHKTYSEETEVYMPHALIWKQLTWNEKLDICKNRSIEILREKSEDF